MSVLDLLLLCSSHDCVPVFWSEKCLFELVSWAKCKHWILIICFYFKSLYFRFLSLLIRFRHTLLLHTGLRMLLMNSVHCWQDAHTCLYWRWSAENIWRLWNTWAESLCEWASEEFTSCRLLLLWLEQSSLLCSVMTGETQRETVWANAILITRCTCTKYLVFVSDAHNDLKCRQV